MFQKRSDDKKDLARKFAIGAAITAVAGYIAGILTAPKSGKDTRQDIKEKATETYAAAEKELKKLHTELDNLIEEASDRLSSLKGSSDKNLENIVEKSRDAKQKTRELLSTLHDGEADDKDLKKAIQEASKAIEHLRDFLKK
jgi:gas vesicle protein